MVGLGGMAAIHEHILLATVSMEVDIHTYLQSERAYLTTHIISWHGMANTDCIPLSLSGIFLSSSLYGRL